MAYSSFEAASLFENRFWMQVLGDHARFIFGALASNEIEEIRQAERFIHIFDRLLETARNELSAPYIVNLNSAAYQRTQEFRSFNLHLLKRRISEKIDINMPPTFLNHMVNEAEEALSVMKFLQAGQIPPLADALHHHLVWLQDAYGHAAGINGGLDWLEKRTKETTESFEKHFEEFYLKAVELAGFTRTGLRHFPGLDRFNREVELEMLLFEEFLNELKELRITQEILGTLMPLLADHMAREECYYLTKLSWVSEVKAPNCDPGKPRVMSHFSSELRT
ncbi:DUF2935 domain-containing protein [Paenibacillus caui]|uniref:DUF2935 domain-containing protein n=1 Tax=Paenibacillus caui TaxID=2873927 RepID=UPI001CA7EAC9|nr:DUF2935 domain-containing protein [Paenibacillus caui]